MKARSPVREPPASRFGVTTWRPATRVEDKQDHVVSANEVLREIGGVLAISLAFSLLVQTLVEAFL